MFVYLGETGESNQLDFVRDATCVAFDWLGQRLYWSVLRNGDVSTVFYEKYKIFSTKVQKL